MSSPNKGTNGCSKGSARRPRLVDAQTYEANWDAAFPPRPRKTKFKTDTPYPHHRSDGLTNRNKTAAKYQGRKPTPDRCRWPICDCTSAVCPKENQGANP